MRFIVIGGGCYGTFYARQLLRAADARAIDPPEILVIDHNEAPQVAREISDARVRVVRSDWDAFFDEYFPNIRDDSDDQIVPPPFTPHLALSWLLRALNARGPLRWGIEPFAGLPHTPFARQAENGTLNASHADWVCPVQCVEPDICPHTKADRWWDMAETVRTFARTLAPRGQNVAEVHLFQCLHLTHGVGAYPASTVVQAFAQLSALDGPVCAIVATVSRCHGTMHLLKGTSGTDTVSPRNGHCGPDSLKESNRHS